MPNWGVGGQGGEGPWRQLARKYPPGVLPSSFGLLSLQVPRTQGPLHAASLIPLSCSPPSQTRAPLSPGSHSGSCAGDPVALGIRGSELEQQPGMGTQRGPGLIWGKLVAPLLQSPGKSGRRKTRRDSSWVTPLQGLPTGTRRLAAIGPRVPIQLLL